MEAMRAHAAEMTLSARELGVLGIGEALRARGGDVRICGCLGERFIGSGASGRRIEIEGTPGNALGAYLDGADIVVRGNAQDAVGDTMNAGSIAVHGNAGDALGYAMRGGEIYVRGDSGYRTGIHMKQYMGERPVIVVGGSAGSFLGEYLAGGLIVVLGLGAEGAPIVGDFPGTGMHGGRIFLRCDAPPEDLPEQVSAARAGRADVADIEPYVRKYCGHFGGDARALLGDAFWVLAPNASNPYRKLYTAH